MLAIADASASCYVCSDCPRPLILGAKNGPRLLEHCSECAVTTVRASTRDIVIRNCLWEGFTCDIFRSTYRLPYSIQKLLGANASTYDGVTLDAIISKNVTHACCASDHCNSATRAVAGPRAPLLLAAALLLLLLIGA